ncbi:hypothetical protein C1J03_24250 (plasmid) [Sulfitobacter sp. SK012]|uniref:molybdopterin-dependent oxidoreductase n=1 Tax=Sulfitobacter sp. SK012 TaxID=1389005 RepID=UPI000E0BF31A|nr:hypothetical protein C1J03_24250 [Sulfitobacter sp. SK012]
MAFLAKYAVGFDAFRAYLMGDQDGIVKSAEWASGICDLPTDAIIDLAKRMSTQKTMISIAWSLNRQDHGEQPYWATIALGALLGGIAEPALVLGIQQKTPQAPAGGRSRLQHFRKARTM